MRLLIILPYFGKFKNYFELFLNSCEKNSKINWLIFTDNHLKRVPDNVQVVETSFERLVSQFKEKMPFDINLNTPYKLCDYKPAYGLLFEEYLKDYDYWGYCDCDLVFGDITHFVSPIINEGYDKIFSAGHLTVYKNTFENNRRFLGSEQQNKAVYGIDKTLGFDEPYFDRRNIHSIFIQSGAMVFEKDYSANPAVKRSQFQLMRYSEEKGTFVEIPYRKTMYVWDHGTIKGLYIEDGDLKTEEYLYMHFQNRDMRMDCTDIINNWECYQIVPNRFIPIHKIPETVDELNSYELEPKNRQLQDIWRMDFKYKINKLMQLLHLR